jgi:hypothetical protein
MIRVTLWNTSLPGCGVSKHNNERNPQRLSGVTSCLGVVAPHPGDRRTKGPSQSTAFRTFLTLAAHGRGLVPPRNGYCVAPVHARSQTAAGL